MDSASDLPSPDAVNGVSLIALADEFGLTSARALELCAEADIPVDGVGAVLTFGQAERFRMVARLPVVESEPEDEPLSLAKRLGVTVEPPPSAVPAPDEQPADPPAEAASVSPWRRRGRRHRSRS